jgi:hypothetical protein
MEGNPWKLATIGLALVGTAALGTGLTTAYMRSPAEAPETAAAPRTLTVPRPLGTAHAVARPAETPVTPA